MPSLLERLKTLPNTGQISYAGNTFSVHELITQADEIRQNYAHLAGQPIALGYTNLAEFITAIIAFDAWCSSIYLCPPNVLLPQDDLIEWPLESETSAPVTDLPNSDRQTNKPTAWYLATSGTTGQPKWYAHSFASLTASTKYSEKLQSLNWALLYQPFRYAGLQVVLQALLSGADLVDSADNEPLALMALLKQSETTAISATPSLWRQLLMTGQLSDLKLRYITLGGEIADQSVLDSLKRLFPQAKLRHIYASTEAGVGLVVSDGLAGFPLTWLDDNSQPVGLKISDDQHLMVKPRFTLCQNLRKQTDSQGYLDTQDRVEVKDGRVLFLGRATGTINVGGNKVHPEEIEQVLMQCVDINQAKVYPKKSPLMGELVVADVTIKPDVDPKLIKFELLKIAKNQLQRFEIPTKINIVNEIAHDPSGKINRK
ncbi:AMP-binding protein [Paraglaciecola arctica]|uniref:AMP-binding protein n=1 Tax=Paraglaciecola arctica TaxID=1128911 RepID=UPI001C06E8DC|nr:class I adenylate-forming enzyme family protein [Paraglaciecola arctica]MBU3002097.1 acyl--CoA ligase [Paraglaciecola arctica]